MISLPKKKVLWIFILIENEQTYRHMKSRPFKTLVDTLSNVELRTYDNEALRSNRNLKRRNQQQIQNK